MSGELGEHHERGAGGLRLPGRLLDPRAVAREVPDDRIDLGERDAHGYGK